MAYSAEDYLRSFLAHRLVLESLLEKIPDDQGDFAAWDGAMSFKGLTDHLSASTFRFAQMMQGEAPAKLEPTESFAAAKLRLNESTEFVQEVLGAMSEADLQRMIEAFGRQMPVFVLVDILREHEIHHKGQLWMMARMVGVEPGMFRKMG